MTEMSHFQASSYIASVAEVAAVALAAHQGAPYGADICEDEDDAEFWDSGHAIAVALAEAGHLCWTPDELAVYLAECKEINGD